LTQGYVTTGTDSGHQNKPDVHGAAFAFDDEAVRNFAYAAYKKTHDVTAKLVQMYYGNSPRRYYYMGGSEGGREGMRMAQQYPQDYDGIVSIDPVMPVTALWNFQNSFGAVQSAPGSFMGTKIQLLHNTVAAVCDGQDGIVDQVVSNYKACTGDVAIKAAVAKRCASEADEGPNCFSDGQLATIKWMYTGFPFPFTLANGVKQYPGYIPGGEGLPRNADMWMTGTVAPTQGADPDTTNGLGRSYLFGSYYTRFFVAKDPKFNALNYNPANYQSRVSELSELLDSYDPDLTKFFQRGGKLILRENIADKGNSPLTGLNYWDTVVAKMGKDTVEKFFVAYVATGLGHTSDGVDAGAQNAPSYGIPGHVDLLGPLDDWVEKGIKPADSFVLTNRKPLPPHDVVASKPMCRYPMYPKFIGSSPAGGNLASNYVCTQ
jgi:feruloyl esterase